MKNILLRFWNQITSNSATLRRPTATAYNDPRPLSGASRCVWQLDSEA